MADLAQTLEQQVQPTGWLEGIWGFLKKVVAAVVIATGFAALLAYSDKTRDFVNTYTNGMGTVVADMYNSILGRKKVGDPKGMGAFPDVQADSLFKEEEFQPQTGAKAKLPRADVKAFAVDSSKWEKLAELARNRANPPAIVTPNLNNAEQAKGAAIRLKAEQEENNKQAVALQKEINLYVAKVEAWNKKAQDYKPVGGAPEMPKLELGIDPLPKDLADYGRDMVALKHGKTTEDWKGMSSYQQMIFVSDKLNEQVEKAPNLDKANSIKSEFGFKNLLALPLLVNRGFGILAGPTRKLAPLFAALKDNGELEAKGVIKSYLEPKDVIKNHLRDLKPEEIKAAQEEATKFEDECRALYEADPTENKNYKKAAEEFVAIRTYIDAVGKKQEFDALRDAAYGKITKNAPAVLKAVEGYNKKVDRFQVESNEYGDFSKNDQQTDMSKLVPERTQAYAPADANHQDPVSPTTLPKTILGVESQTKIG